MAFGGRAGFPLKSSDFHKALRDLAVKARQAKPAIVLDVNGLMADIESSYRGGLTFAQVGLFWPCPPPCHLHIFIFSPTAKGSLRAWRRDWVLPAHSLRDAQVECFPSRSSRSESGWMALEMQRTRETSTDRWAGRGSWSEILHRRCVGPLAAVRERPRQCRHHPRPLLCGRAKRPSYLPTRRGCKRFAI